VERLRSFTEKERGWDLRGRSSSTWFMREVGGWTSEDDADVDPRNLVPVDWGSADWRNKKLKGLFVNSPLRLFFQIGGSI
jgi:hypothetical protein